MSEFHLFPSLPKELRLKIWRTTLTGQNRLVTVAPGHELLACRSGLPVLSAVNRESRQEFLRLYVRLRDRPDAGTAADVEVDGHVYFNPRLDTLVIGTDTKTGSALKSSGGMEALLLFARCPVGTLVDAPALPEPAAEQVRQVHLYDLNPSRRMEMDSSLKNRKLEWGPGRDEPMPLPRLRFPNLDAVVIVTLHASLWVGNFKCHGSRGRHFRYVEPTNQVYYHIKDAAHGDSFAGMRPASRIPDEYLKPTPAQTRAMRIEIIRSGDDGNGWVTNDWHLISGPDDFCHDTWVMLVQYITLRLGRQDDKEPDGFPYFDTPIDLILGTMLS
ncbi:hypothetical protein CH63R_07623 [Colletotrichum higginsianum IMI 349063]|uniref:2EXR domain-containing protein n=1 Tax=Colletotrichum higginsianum (strain IMI 349063) TaxID=759273 RepID=A0A1B7YAF1_COLHI|nr:hypothetical protein CH63R_07623 [Colletotrichum higginsianum IMI 349063]OBR08858.1 hypothetical protein CH63R_07623 [Colletotrichum higginsianum IMI 349063]